MGRGMKMYNCWKMLVRVCNCHLRISLRECVCVCVWQHTFSTVLGDLLRELCFPGC